MRPPTPLRRELLVSFGVLFVGALLIAGMGLGVIIPIQTSPAQGLLYVTVLVGADLVVLFFFTGAIVRSRLVAPMEELAEDARRIAEGDFRHRIRSSESLELQLMGDSVNAMADRLITDQARLAANVASLEDTNRELVEARDQVIQSARLASVGTLAAGIAHEVGNPLGAIMAYVDVARTRAQRQGHETEVLDSIRGEVDRIDRIVRGLLDYARPRDAGVGPHDVGEVVARVRELLLNQGKLDRVEHLWDVDSDVPMVIMESHRLEQVLVNLLINAVDATADVPDPRIHVRVAAREGDIGRMPLRRADDPPGINYLHRRRVVDEEGTWIVSTLRTAAYVVVVEVSDNGSGILESDLDSVFDPFFTTKEPGKGTGLGLSICARLVEGMGGRIEARQNPGGGACFVVELPGVTAGEVADAAP
ncbi:MAG: ATP-binding protein [Gemmatimonadota bacterium]|nr:ATP-binding protein [Gemmatimonadota bacterium]MDH5758826.1 ATP-binding protein [Gemmatimonadota bacterium]